MTPSDFELTRHPEFAKTDAYHFAISAKNDLLWRKHFFPHEGQQQLTPNYTASWSQIPVVK